MTSPDFAREGPRRLGAPTRLPPNTRTPPRGSATRARQTATSGTEKPEGRGHAAARGRDITVSQGRHPTVPEWLAVALHHFNEVVTDDSETHADRHR